MGKFRQFLTELSARDTSIFLFPDDYSSKCQWIFTKLDMCIDIVKIWFGIVDGQISTVFDRVICPRQDNAGLSSCHVFFFFFFVFFFFCFFFFVLIFFFYI